MFFEEKLPHDLGIQNFHFQIMLSHEINLTKYVGYFFEKYFYLCLLELIRELPKMISRYLMLNHNGKQALKNMHFIIL